MLRMIWSEIFSFFSEQLKSRGQVIKTEIFLYYLFGIYLDF
jgi:hypothetical protein